MVNYAVRQFELHDVCVCVCVGRGGKGGRGDACTHARDGSSIKYSKHFSLKCLMVFSKQLRTCACLQNHIKIQPSIA